MYPYEILHLPISHTPAIVIFCLTFNSFNRFLLHIFVILEATLKFFMFFTLFFKLLSLSFSLTSHSYLPHPSSIFSLNSVNFIIYFLLRAVVISNGFTFVSSKIFILRPITPLVCVALRLLWVLITLGLRLRPSFALPPLTDCPRHVLARSAASISRCC